MPEGKDDLDKLVDELVDGIGDDRDRLVDFIDKLIAGNVGAESIIAEQVAKLLDAATKQHNAKAEVLKSLLKKRPSEKTDYESVASSIGSPFEDVEDGSN